MGCTDIEGFSAVARDHAARPRNHGPLEDFDGHARMTGSCGDTMEFWLAAKNGKVEWVSFITDGCGSSLACGSIATSLARGKRVEDAAALEQKDIFEALGGFPPRVRALRCPDSEYPQGGMRIAQDVGVSFLGSILIDPKIAEACDSGRGFVHRDATTPMAEVMWQVIQPIFALSDTCESAAHNSTNVI